MRTASDHDISTCLHGFVKQSDQKVRRIRFCRRRVPWRSHAHESRGTYDV